MEQENMCLEWLQFLLSKFTDEWIKMPSNFTCGICMESLHPEKKFRRKRCSHPYCTDCISLHIATTVQDDRSKVKCPSPGCNKFLDPLSCRPILPNATFERWCDALCASAVVGLSTTYCPFRDCSELVMSDCSDFVTKAECPRCKRMFCFKCKARWHSGYYCDEKGVRKEKNDVLFDRLAMRSGWRWCPRCKRCLERINGCDTVMCRCGLRFCYNCGAELPWYKTHHICEKSRNEEFGHWSG